MASVEKTWLEDDIDHDEASETVCFSLDGTAYEIDLNDKNATTIREALAPFIAAAPRRFKASRRRQGSGTKGAPAGNAENRARSADIRAWAKRRGIKINARGRIPAAVVAKYDREMGPRLSRSPEPKPTETPANVVPFEPPMSPAAKPAAAKPRTRKRTTTKEKAVK